MNHYEPDTCRCHALTDTKHRCTRVATHDNGSGKLLCERHHQLAQAKKANDAPILRKVK